MREMNELPNDEGEQLDIILYVKELTTGNIYRESLWFISDFHKNKIKICGVKPFFKTATGEWFTEDGTEQLIGWDEIDYDYDEEIDDEKENPYFK